jgi:hypothetical protein
LTLPGLELRPLGRPACRKSPYRLGYLTSLVQNIQASWSNFWMKYCRHTVTALNCSSKECKPRTSRFTYPLLNCELSTVTNNRIIVNNNLGVSWEKLERFYGVIPQFTWINVKITKSHNTPADSKSEPLEYHTFHYVQYKTRH